MSRFLSTVLLGLSALIPLRADSLKPQLSETAKEVCHQISFGSWKVPERSPEGQRVLGIRELEFRVQRSPSPVFLVGAPLYIFGEEIYAPAKYRIDLSDPKSKAERISEEEWEAAFRVPLYKEPVPRFDAKFNPPARPAEVTLEYQGMPFDKTGDKWFYPEHYATRLSPDQTHLVVQSYTGDHVIGDGLPLAANAGRITKGVIYLDVYSAGTGHRLITVPLKYGWDSYDWLGRAAWVTERFYLVPLDERQQKALVCEFGRGN